VQPRAGGVAMELYLPHHPAQRHLIAQEFQDRLQGAGIDAMVVFLERRTVTAPR
jgi:hypothetical protein